MSDVIDRRVRQHNPPQPNLRAGDVVDLRGTGLINPPPVDPHLGDRLDLRGTDLVNPPPLDPRAGDTSDQRSSRQSPHIGIEDFFTLPHGALPGQRVSSTFGMIYEFDGTQWSQVGTAASTSYVFNIGLIEAGGTVDATPATTVEIGSLLEAPDGGIPHVRTNLGGVGTWTPAAAGLALTWGIGIDEVPPASGTIDLVPATPAVIGGVSVPGRALTQGLALDVSGVLTAPTATDLLAGSIVEPPPDGLQYARSRDMVGVSTWVPVVSGGAFVGDDPPVTPAPTQGSLWFESDTGKLFLFFIDAGGPPGQFVQVGGPG